MPLLDSTHYPAIRKAIKSSVTVAECPDDLIAQDNYLWAALTWVESRVEDVDSLTGDDLKHARLAAINYCAHKLALVVVPVKSESNAAGSSYSQDTVGPSQRSRQLLADAEAELAFLTEEDEISNPPPRSGSVTNRAVW